MIKNILVPIDGSEYAEKAVTYAIGIARKFDAKLLLLNVVPRRSFQFADGEKRVREKDIVEMEERGGREVLKKAKDLADFQAVMAETRIAFGDPSDEILKICDSECPSLIIMGVRGRGEVKSIFLGSVSNRIIHHSPCPVLIIK